MNRLPLRLSCLLTAKKRHILSVFKELFAVPKLEPHLYVICISLCVLIGRPLGREWAWECLALFVVVSCPLVPHCWVWLCRFLLSETLNTCSALAYFLLDIPRLIIQVSPVAVLCHFLVIYTTLLVCLQLVIALCNKSVARTKYWMLPTTVWKIANESFNYGQVLLERSCFIFLFILSIIELHDKMESKWTYKT